MTSKNLSLIDCEIQVATRKKVFGKKTITTYNVNAFFFQLVATGILTFKWMDAESKVVCTFGTDDKVKIKYKTQCTGKDSLFATH